MPASPGTYKGVLGTNSPLACANGTYANVSGMSFCYLCAPSTQSPLGSEDKTDCQCISGYTGADGGPCTSCDKGKYKRAAGSNVCDLCAQGKYSDQHASTVCFDCPLLTTTSLQGQGHLDKCTCIQGYERNDLIDGCAKCPKGTYKDTNGNDRCGNCPSGTYSDQIANTHMSFCLSCPPTTSSPEGSEDVTACICAKGYTGVDGAECNACVPGKFKSIRGSSICSLCPRGTYSEAFAAVSVVICLQCDAGKYSGLMGAENPDTCTNCAPGKYSEIRGSSTELNCVLCFAGTSSNLLGADSPTTCTPCAIGKYSDYDGKTLIHSHTKKHTKLILS